MNVHQGEGQSVGQGFREGWDIDKTEGCVMERVTQKTVSTLGDGRYRADPGLYLVVRKDGRYRAWVFRYKFQGKRKDMGLGDATIKRLVTAKADALAAREMLSRGIDPISERRRFAQASEEHPETFEEFFRRVWETRMKVKRYKDPGTPPRYKRMVEKYALPIIGGKAIADVTVMDIKDVLEPIWTTMTNVPKTLRGILSDLFSFAIATGAYHGPNPALWRDGLEAFLPSREGLRPVKHRDALSLPALKTALGTLWDKCPTVISARLVIFIALCACRHSEARHAKWSEIDFERKIFTVPPERRKDGKQEGFRIPLSDQALELLSICDRHGEYVFPSRYSPEHVVSNIAALQTLQRCAGGTSIHGFRSTFRDWAAESGVDFIVAEKCLMHATGSATVVAYQRSDLLERRRPVMQEWADTILPGKKMPREA